jgi:hypothetical protein
LDIFTTMTSPPTATATIVAAQRVDGFAVNGQIYKKFRHDCKDRLVGLKLAARKSQDYRESYVRSLWNEATRKNAIWLKTV